MRQQDDPRAPALLRWLVLLASWIVARRERGVWRSRHERELQDWWLLVEIGELSTRSSREIARSLRQACVESLWARIGEENLRRFLRGPAMVAAAGCALFGLLAVLSHGFAATRGIAAVFRVMLFPPENLPHAAPPLHGGDMVFAFSAPIIFALAVAILFVGFRHRPVYASNWNYWLFLGAKVAAVATLVPLAWIELSALVRAHIAPSEYRVILTGLSFRLVFIVLFVQAIGWCFADQERRCPICLRRLANPVSIGNCSNVFEPAVTEFLCERGHGVLSVPEMEGTEADRWIAFDASWSELFEVHGR